MSELEETIIYFLVYFSGQSKSLKMSSFYKSYYYSV